MAVGGHLPAPGALISKIVRIVPRWILIVVLLIVVFFVVTTCIGHAQKGGSNKRGDFKPSPPSAIAKLFYRPTPVKDEDLSSGCLSQGVITVTGSACNVAVHDSHDQARELKLRRDAGVVGLTVKVPDTDEDGNPDFTGNPPVASVSLTDKSAVITVTCSAGPCTLTIVRS